MYASFEHYLAYLANHREHVLRAANDLGIASRGIRHDLSKYEPDEFVPYAEYFYGSWRNERDQAPEDIQVAFDHAWLLHQKRNPHHWQYWVLREDSGTTKTLRMSEVDIREMVADWRGASLAIMGRDSTLEWYLGHRANMLLHPDTCTLVEKLLDVPTRMRRPGED